MKLRVPEGCHAASHAGQAIEIADDESVEVEDGVRKVLMSHGFTLWDDGLAMRTMETNGSVENRTMKAAVETSIALDGIE